MYCTVLQGVGIDKSYTRVEKRHACAEHNPRNNLPQSHWILKGQMKRKTEETKGKGKEDGRSEKIQKPVSTLSCIIVVIVREEEKKKKGTRPKSRLPRTP